MEYNNHLLSNAFNGKTAVVTGAGQGIGFEICRRLAREGATVLLNDIDADLAEHAAGKISRLGRCVACPGDSSDLGFIKRLVERAVVETGSLDIAIANAGITLFGNFLDYKPESFFKVMEVNLGGTFFLAQEAAKQFIKQRTGGSLLFMSSATGHQAHKQLAAYGMSKAALEMLAKHLVVELSPFGINVNTVAPGATLTERTAADNEYEATWARLTPLGRPGTPEDVAAAACFLVSDGAKHITGQTLIVDGGWTVVSPSP
ncbi:NAD(P)-dependent dehydrogenase, short-chain alcohol dehydrogenase family [Parapedobacter composti]|uniref:NAD(P)-dependent dehydrogenase, short-chain alcohol dehydrogenase family n=1 Tax=Parapedobacter composti TaxID=623281 RepID=A0A1I1K0L7_9SPHI|nr:SDR family oxidoreductase [Parapedobacter composti]SFC52298.1 NAD(P)-dependent dehydrogenase, short-chain alcohol dehydrogenase family [Parapedobacter composti]